MTDGFGARLRSQRQRQGIALDAIANTTKISVGLLKALERDDLSQWPAGIFRRAFIRAYAKEIGVDPEATLREFLQRFPDASSELGADHGATALRAEAVPLRITFADDAAAHSPRRIASLHGWPQRLSAAACDLAVVLAIASAIVAIAGLVWAPLAIAIAVYHVGGAIALGTTPGGWLVTRARAARHRDQRTAPIEVVELTSAAIDAASNVREFRRRGYPKAV
jgi:transcriptional regulator with XRE-family HTH domain